MLIAEAQIETERPSRYLVQLCRHAENMGRHGGPMLHRPRARHLDKNASPPEMPEVQTVECSDVSGRINFSWGTSAIPASLTMKVDAGTLMLRAEAADEESLLRIQNLVARRLETIGRRDHLTVAWRRGPDVPAAAPGETAQTGDPRPAEHQHHGQPSASTTRRRPFAAGWPVVAVIALIVAAHLGLFGAMLASSRWTDGAAIGLMALFLLKAVLVKIVGRHFIAARHGTRGRMRDRGGEGGGP